MQKSSCQQDGFLNALFRSLRLKMQNTPRALPSGALSLRSLKQLHLVNKLKEQK